MGEVLKRVRGHGGSAGLENVESSYIETGEM